MKKKLMILYLIGAFVLTGSTVYSQELLYNPTKAEMLWDNVSEKSQEITETTVVNLKSGSKKTAKFVKEKSKSAVDKATPYVQSGAKKAKTSTIRGANKITNSTAKGLKRAGRKLEESAERAIEKTDKTLQETEPKCNCGKNCRCNKTNIDSEE